MHSYPARRAIRSIEHERRRQCDFMRCVFKSAGTDGKAQFTGAFAINGEKTFVIWVVDSGHRHRFLNRLNLPLLLASRTIQFGCRKGWPLEIVETQPEYSKVVHSSQEFSTIIHQTAIIKLLFYETAQNPNGLVFPWGHLIIHCNFKGNTSPVTVRSLRGFCIPVNVSGKKSMSW